jgi:enediyne biosynthesis protein E5
MSPTTIKQPAPQKDTRLPALRRFAFAITFLNILGHTVLGFEPSWLVPFVALGVGYTLEILLEIFDARVTKRPLGFQGGIVKFVDFLLPAHITSLACSMLLYSNKSIGPVVFAIVIAITSKYILRAPIGKGTRHFLNPSNTGIGLTLIAFPWVGVAPPYHFVENVGAVGDWLLPCVIICTGSLLNGLLTKKLPLIAGWVGGFIAQALFRATFFEFRLEPMLGVMPGVAFVLFTFYMISDPATTPMKTKNQVIFGLSVAALYGFINIINVVYSMFIALMLVCTIRGGYLHWIAWRARVQAGLQVPAAAVPIGAGTAAEPALRAKAGNE